MHFLALLTAAVGILSSVEAVPTYGHGPIAKRAGNFKSDKNTGKAAGTGATSKAVAATATTAVAATSAAGGAVSLSTSAAAAQVAQLKVADTAISKLNILSDDSDWKFDFNTATQGAIGTGGFITTANIASMPATEMTGSSMAIGVMGPCGFATPHSHPRANELNLIIEGTLQSTMTLENSARTINQTMTKLQMTIFPQGSMHMEINPACTNATFVSAFTSNDAGVQQTAQTFMDFGDQILTSAMGGAMTVDGKDIDTFRSQIPVNVAQGVDSCLAACSIKKRSLDETKIMRRNGQLAY